MPHEESFVLLFLDRGREVTKREGLRRSGKGSEGAQPHFFTLCLPVKVRIA